MYAKDQAKKAKEPEPDAMGKDLKQSNGKLLDTETQFHTEVIENRAPKSSVLTKGIGKHSRYHKSGHIHEHARHLRTSSVGSNVMTLNGQGSRRGYAKLADQTFKSGDFSKMKTEIEDIDMDPDMLNGRVGIKGHRRKMSAIKKVNFFTNS